MYTLIPKAVLTFRPFYDIIIKERKLYHKNTPCIYLINLQCTNYYKHLLGVDKMPKMWYNIDRQTDRQTEG